MKLIKTRFKDAFLIIPTHFEDSRGYFYESFNQNVFEDNTNIQIEFVQDNHSLSNKNVLRGLHYQKPPFEQAKLVRVVSGCIYDVIVDLRKNSQTFGMWESYELTSENRQQLWIPKGFAHGFLSMSDSTQVIYKTDNYYNKDSAISIRYNDPHLNIKWPIDNPVQSENDLKGISFSNL